MFKRVALPILKKSLSYSEPAVSHVRAYHPPADYKEPSMNDLPIPSGSWQSQYNSNQSKYNIQLIGGVSFLAFTIAFVAKSGILEFNVSPPPLKPE